MNSGIMELVIKQVGSKTYDAFWDNGWENHTRFEIATYFGNKPYIKFSNRFTPTNIKNLIISRYLYGKE